MRTHKRIALRNPAGRHLARRRRPTPGVGAQFEVSSFETAGRELVGGFRVKRFDGEHLAELGYWVDRVLVGELVEAVTIQVDRPEVTVTRAPLPRQARRRGPPPQWYGTCCVGGGRELRKADRPRLSAGVRGSPFHLFSGLVPGGPHPPCPHHTEVSRRVGGRPSPRWRLASSRASTPHSSRPSSDVRTSARRSAARACHRPRLTRSARSFIASARSRSIAAFANTSTLRSRHSSASRRDPLDLSAPRTPGSTSIAGGDRLPSVRHAWPEMIRVLVLEGEVHRDARRSRTPERHRRSPGVLEPGSGASPTSARCRRTSRTPVPRRRDASAPRRCHPTRREAPPRLLSTSAS